jgi:tRNA (adenine22-N1)-methyltransferase
MQLSKRLQTVADLVTQGNRVADVGCDHAYISIYLAEKNISPFIVAMDINQGPIDRAKENIGKYGYSGRIDVRKSDGLQMLKAGEADTVLIAGMGGALTVEILTKYPEALVSVKELILQPQSEIHLVREALSELDFLITAENMVKEDGKYYTCMKAETKQQIKDCKVYELTKQEYIYFGRLLLEHKNPILLEYLRNEKQQCENIYKTLIAFPTDQSILRQKEITDEIKLIEQGFGYFK